MTSTSCKCNLSPVTYGLPLLCLVPGLLIAKPIGEHTSPLYNRRLSPVFPHVHGTARDDSDIDVLIDFDPQAAIGLFEFIEIQDQLSEALGRKVDLLTPQALSKYFRDEVLQEAEPVYEA